MAGPLRLRVRALDSAMRDRIRAAGARACDEFLGRRRPAPLLDAGAVSPRRRAGSLPGTTEVMLHPGHLPTHVRTGFAAEREIELAAAVDARVREAFGAAGVALVGVLPE